MPDAAKSMPLFTDTSARSGWIAHPAETAVKNRLTCGVHAEKEDEFNRRNREASWTAAQRAKFLKKEVGTFIAVSTSQGGTSIDLRDPNQI